MYASILLFSYLQILDFLSTIAFVALGVQEANPMVRMALSMASNPIGGLLLVKIGAIALGIYCWKRGSTRVLRTANVIFACLIVWNLFAVIAGAAKLY